MSKPVIALVIEGTYPWYRGGVSEWVARYLIAFPDYHFHIIQIASEPYLKEELSNALYAVPRQVKEFKRILPPVYQKNWETEVSAWLSTHYEIIKPSFVSTDIIHIANTGFAGWLGMKIARETEKPLILTEHALYWKEVALGATALECGYMVPAGTEAKNRMTELFKQIAMQVYGTANEVISVSRCNIQNQQALGATDVHYIPNGVDENWLQPHTKRNEAPVVGWVGRCAEMKNPLRFFGVIDAFHSAEAETRYLMMICNAGEPELQRQVKQKAKEYPELKLICNQPAEKYLSEMDVLCITSLNESQPLVLFEALAKRVLPIGWEVGDVTSEFGIVVPAGNSAEVLTQKVMELWRQPKLWNRQVDQRFRMVKSSHTWPQIFSKYRKLFNLYLKK